MSETSEDMSTSWLREASIRWLGNPPGGVPRLTVGSRSIAALPLSIDRDAVHPLATTPGELLAGAIGSIFAELTVEELAKAGTHAKELTTNITLALAADARDNTDFALSAITCQLFGRVPKTDQAHFAAAAQRAMERCITAVGMQAGDVAATTEAVLEGG